MKNADGSDVSGGQVLFLAGLAVVLCIPQYLLYGFVVWHLWTWFAVPLGLIQITMIHCIGLGILGKKLCCISGVQPDVSFEAIIGQIAMSLIGPFFTLFAGYVLHCWM